MEREKVRFRQLVVDTRTERDRVRRLVAAKRWREAEPDPERLEQYIRRRIAKSVPPGAEAIVGDTDDMQPAVFLPEGAQIRRAIAYIEVSDARGSTVGSGFLVSPSLILTNNHVIPDASAALGVQVTFDREIDELGRP